MARLKIVDAHRVIEFLKENPDCKKGKTWDKVRDIVVSETGVEVSSQQVAESMISLGLYARKKHEKKAQVPAQATDIALAVAKLRDECTRLQQVVERQSAEIRDIRAMMSVFKPTPRLAVHA